MKHTHLRLAYSQQAYSISAMYWDPLINKMAVSLHQNIEPENVPIYDHSFQVFLTQFRRFFQHIIFLFRATVFYRRRIKRLKQNFP